ncbi:hypothetical protein [Paractinoplanes rishiriensis]|uniref:Uncharacterized protein n=1 Tax=Paractinoplanes rishiriensis TaxID=1050105 RepID=A0A919MSL2_9ACTN|nr:hypothetical protein [Actinoplanes rishiriensis]GIE98316.1 hypothetical protein Ari01nite_57810 [Actinoplanes rishiriensis]
MGIVHIVVLTVALLTLLTLPCVVAAILGHDPLALRDWWTGRALSRLDRHMVAVSVDLPAPSFEQIAYDLRRLGHQRYHGPNRQSVKWQSAVMSAYDLRLSLACQCLGLPEHLGPLEGMDRDLERMRLESQLQAAGLALR